MIGGNPSFTVSDFVAVFNQSLDMLFPSVVIVGELSNLRISKGMWVYCDLKDDFSSVRFFGTTRALPGPLEDGMMVEVFGRPYLHPKFGFSVQIDSVQAVGEGSIKKAQDLLAKKLEAEGLFDPARKRNLPFPPTRIGLVTSVESAAFSDFTKIIAARWPALEIEMFDVQVQGVDAPGQIVAAIEKANQSSELDALVLIRGGGSKDDLQAFDHEVVVRAVAGSRIPSLVAIGHERDVALSELAADQRASTPSNAAELLVPDRSLELNDLQRLKLSLNELMVGYCDTIRRDTQHISERAQDLLLHKLRDAQQQLHTSKKLMQLLDPRQPLERGFAIVKDAKGKVLRSADLARTASLLTLEFNDGNVQARPEGK
jgi:exodeoxyribonuclease VII large subunit